MEQGFFSSREQAQRAVMAGEVRIGDQVMNKSSIMVEPGAAVWRSGAVRPMSVAAASNSKARSIIRDFAARADGPRYRRLHRRIHRLSAPARRSKVYAIDVGHGQLAWKIRNDPRVIVREKLNARYLTREDIPEPIDLCVIDVSFISLTLILPNAFDLVTPNGVILALIKPQFELQADRRGPRRNRSRSGASREGAEEDSRLRC